MNGCIVICEVVGHILDFIFDTCEVCTLFGDDEAFADMLLARSQFGVGAATDSIECRFDGNSILLTVKNTFYSADRIRMALRNTLTPEGIGIPSGSIAEA